MTIRQISAKDLQKKIAEDAKLTLLDVRELHEFEFACIEGSLHIPLHQIAQRMDEIDSVIDCVAICHHGIRSQQAAAFLAHSGLTNIYNLSGGIDAWSVDCDSTVSRY